MMFGTQHHIGEMKFSQDQPLSIDLSQYEIIVDERQLFAQK